jgi:hypothetical protein
MKEDEEFEVGIDEEEYADETPQEATTSASYTLPAPPQDYASTGPQGSAPMASQDEAFSRALNAMYWGGYWTAVYHVCRCQSSSVLCL